MSFGAAVLVLALVVGVIYGCGGAATISQEEQGNAETTAGEGGNGAGG